MRINQISIDGFGVFANQQVELSPKLNVFVGDNEAGKSTLLQFLRFILFGSKRGIPPALVGGKLGGRLNLEFDRFGPRTLVRHAKGQGILTTPDPKAVTITIKEALGGLSAEVFRNVFAFSLSELRDLDSLHGDELRGLLYGAASGTAILALPKAQKKLETLAGEIFKPTGQNPTLNQKLQEVSELRARLDALSHNIEEYEAACSRVGELQSKLEDQRNVLRDTQTAHKNKTSILQVWGVWESLRVGEREINTRETKLSRFPLDGLTVYERLNSDLEIARNNKISAEMNLQELLSEMEGINVNASVLAAAKQIEEFQQTRMQYLTWQKDLVTSQSAETQLTARLKADLETLGPTWTETYLKSISWLDQANAELTEHRSSFEQAQSQTVAARDIATARSKEIEDTNVRMQALKVELSDLGIGLAPIDSSIVSPVRAGRDKFAADISAHGNLTKAVRETEAELLAQLRSINPAWSELSVKQFDTHTFRKLINECSEALDNLSATQEGYQSQLDAENHNLRAALAALDSLHQSLKSLPTPKYSSQQELQRQRENLSALSDAVAAVEKSMTDMNHAQQLLNDRMKVLEAERQQKPRERSTGAAVVVIVLSMATGLAGLLINGALPLIALAIIGLGAGAYLLHTQTKVNAIALRESKSKIEALEHKVSEAQNELTKCHEAHSGKQAIIEELALNAGLPSPATNSIKIALESLQHEERNLLQFEQCQQAFQAAERLLEDTIRDVANAKLECERHRVQAQACSTDWKARFATEGIICDVAPILLERLLADIEKVQTRLKSLDTDRTRLGELAVDLRKFRTIASVLPSVQQNLSASDEHILTAVDQELNAFDKNADNAARQQKLSGELSGLESRLKEAQLAYAEADAANQSALSELTARDRAWKNWLKGKELSTDLTFRETQLKIEQIQQAKVVLSELESTRRLCSTLSEQIQSFCDRLSTLLSSLGREFTENADPIVFVDQLARELDDSKKLSTKRDQLAGTIKKTQENQSTVAAAISAPEGKLKAFLESTGCTTHAELQELSKLAAETEKLRAELEAKRATLKATLACPTWEEAIVILESLTSEQLLRDIDLLKQRATELQLSIDGDDSREIAGTEDQLAKARADVEYLSTSDEVTQLRAREESLLTEISQLAKRWQLYTVASHLLDQAKTEFEATGQPKVLEEASGYLSKITGGRYVRIQAITEKDKQKLQVLSYDGIWKSVDELSTGTQEQLYLSLRFGFIVHRLETTEPVPIVMDDILVNFDQARSQKACEAIISLAQTSQTMFFTCHPGTVEQFLAHDDSCRIIELQSGAFSLTMREGSSVKA